MGADHSRLSLLTAGLACLAPLANAYTQPVGDPNGNPFSQPGLNSVLAVGQNFTVTWKPTTTGSITLLLLKGPAENIKVLYPLVEGAKNTGSYVWTPDTDLTPGPTEATGYGLQLIDDATGQYQYTTQFGISNPNPHAGDDDDSHGPHGYGGDHGDDGDDDEDWGNDSSSSAVPSHTGRPSLSKTGTTVAPTGWYPSNSTTAVVAKPTAPASSGGVPTYSPTSSSTPTTLSSSAAAASSSKASTASASAPGATGAASTMSTSFGGIVLAAGLAIFAF